MIVASIALAIVLAVVVAVSVAVRVDTGEWRVPDGDDFVRIAQRVGHHPSKTIYLARESLALRPGEDDASAGFSSVLASARNAPVKTRAWTGGNSAWARLVDCVTKQFAPFDVVVTDRRPASQDYILVAVGGVPRDIGIKNHDITGLAPFNGGVIPRAVVYAFAARSGNDVRAVCETVAMEVAHAYGLDHEYLCKDNMTYLPRCGSRSFVDADAPCGEAKKRPCEGGATTQNSYRRLAAVLGARQR